MKLRYFLPVILLIGGCDVRIRSQPTANSGVSQMTANVVVQANGMSVEQENIKRRVESDNKLGAIKYLYVVSPFSGDVVLSSTVNGKVTSSGKRLSPASGDQVNFGELNGFQFAPGKFTNEMIQDDGTYGSSSEYIYWWDVNGTYNQITAGAMMVIITDQPRRFNKVILNLDNK